MTDDDALVDDPDSYDCRGGLIGGLLWCFAFLGLVGLAVKGVGWAVRAAGGA